MTIMKPLMSLFFVLCSVAGLAQTNVLSRELMMGYGGFTQHEPTQYDFQTVDKLVGTKFSEVDFVTETWYVHPHPINEFKFGGAVGIRRTKDFSKELLFDLSVAGQFKHRTFFHGTTETLQEETTIDVKTGRVRQNLAFKTMFMSEIRDLIFVNPGLSGRVYLNQRLGFHASASVGVGFPFRNGFQVSSYEGEIIREIEEGKVLNEVRNSFGEVEFEWFKLPFVPSARAVVMASVEVKPFDMRSLYAMLGGSLGYQQELSSVGNGFVYSGFELGIISRF